MESGNTANGGEGSGGSNNGSGGGGGIVSGGIASGGMGGGGFNHNEGEDSEDPTSVYKPHKQEYSGDGGGGGRRGYASFNQGRRQMLAKLGIKVKPKKPKKTSKRTSLIETSQNENIFARITSRFNELCKNKIDCY